MTIKVQTKSVYGNELIYPICEKAKAFARLAGKKTLAGREMVSILELGFAIEEINTGGTYTKSGFIPGGAK